MPSVQISGRTFTTAVFTSAAHPGTEITFPVPVKSFILMPVGGNVTFRKLTGDSAAGAFPISDGQTMQMDILLDYPISSNVSSLGFVNGAGVPVYVIAAY